MRSRIAAVLLGMTTVIGAGSILSVGQEPTKPSTQSRRVPANFSKVGVTPEQKERIYSIRGKYQEQILAAQRKIDDLKAKELAECESVLTDAQRQQLTMIRSETGKGKSKAQ